MKKVYVALMLLSGMSLVACSNEDTPDVRQPDAEQVQESVEIRRVDLTASDSLQLATLIPRIAEQTLHRIDSETDLLPLLPAGADAFAYSIDTGVYTFLVGKVRLKSDCACVTRQELEYTQGTFAYALDYVYSQSQADSVYTLMAKFEKLNASGLVSLRTDAVQGIGTQHNIWLSEKTSTQPDISLKDGECVVIRCARDYLRYMTEEEMRRLPSLAEVDFDKQSVLLWHKFVSSAISAISTRLVPLSASAYRYEADVRVLYMSSWEQVYYATVVDIIPESTSIIADINVHH